MTSFTKHRTRSKIDKMPKHLKEQLDEMLLNIDFTYKEIAEELTKLGYPVSKSTVGNYAVKSNKIAFRLQEKAQQFKSAMEFAKTNKNNEDFTEAGLQFATMALTQRLASIDEEIDELETKEVIKLQQEMAKTKAMQDRTFTKKEKIIKNAFDSAKEEVNDLLSEFFEKNPEAREELFKKLELRKEKIIDKERSKG